MAIDHLALVAELTSRWPEHRVAPSTARVEALLDLLGAPQRAMPVILIAGTNGKGSTAIMIDALVRSAGMRTGRFSSPHLVSLTERICIDGEPISNERFDELYQELAPYIQLIDDRQIDGVAMTFFEVMTAMAYAAFADAPVEVAIVEVGLGGTWDATNVVDPAVAVICPIDFDHTHLLGDTLTDIATEKAGIIKVGSRPVLASQSPEAGQVLLARAAEVGAVPALEGVDFGLLGRELAVGGQLIRIETGDGPVGDLYLPLFGEHMARNAALAAAAVEALYGKALTPEVLADGFAAVEAPARLELVRRSPAIVIDTAHNPHGVRATMAGLKESFDFQHIVAVIAMMADKDIAQVLSIIAEDVEEVVVTTVASTDRGIGIDELREVAEENFAQVHEAPSISAAIDLATGLADAAGTHSGVLVIGSVIAAGEARALLAKDEQE